MYVVQSNIATGNLILNGSFELGVVGFSSEYINNQVTISWLKELMPWSLMPIRSIRISFAMKTIPQATVNSWPSTAPGVANVKVWYLTLTNVQPDVDGMNFQPGSPACTRPTRPPCSSALTANSDG